MVAPRRLRNKFITILRSWQGGRRYRSTKPARFVALPTSPSSNARDRVHQRNPTPCTCPCTQAVSRTGAAGLSGSVMTLHLPMLCPRGGRWQWGQKYDDRFIHLVRAIGRPQRAHGFPARP